MRKLLLIVLLVVMNLVPAVATAQPTGSIRDSLPSKPLKDKWDQGVDSFKDGTFDAALVEFEAVYEATKNPRILYNISVCHRKLSQFSQAITALERQLTFRDELSKKEVERAEKLLERIARRADALTVHREGMRLDLRGADQPIDALPTLLADAGRALLQDARAGDEEAERALRHLFRLSGEP